jgi:uncharacterized protein YndB with AHSA1/START domain
MLRTKARWSAVVDVVSMEKDFDRLTLTMVVEVMASVERCWRLWADPRQLERWWGPPGFPAAVEVHELTPGGRVTYTMTGPEGERYPGWWQVIQVDAPNRLVVQDGYSDLEGNPDPNLPTTLMGVHIVPASPISSTMTIISEFTSEEAFQQVLQMGAEEGMLAALSQIDAILAD